ncbi:MAG: polysaccharide lyase family 7 protein [Flavobacteriaceae bacterium]
MKTTLNLLILLFSISFVAQEKPSDLITHLDDWSILLGDKPQAYSGELQFFKAGAYNQSNGKDPSKNNVWNTGSNSFEGNIEKQYENGDYAEVWFNSIKLN